MEKCPVCRAASAGRKICHRCGTDLLLFKEMEQQSLEFFSRAVQALKEYDYDKARSLARRSCSLKYSRRAARLLFHAGSLRGKDRGAIFSGQEAGLK